ncbi:MAG TPA: hypothetical protein VKD72_15070, partial [Gemmataceae bacterium]|nr:hypothetical protein [Gemmataceae bacterium]
MQRQQGITAWAGEAAPPGGRLAVGTSQDNVLPPSQTGRRSGVMPVKGTLNRSQCLLDLVRKMTGASCAGVGLVSADGQLVEHLNSGCAPEMTDEAGSAWVVALTEQVHRPHAGTGEMTNDPVAAVSSPCLPGSEPGPLLAIPLTYSNRCPGVLYAARAPGSPAFGPDEKETARLIGACFEQGNLFEEAHLLTRLQVLNQVAQAGTGNFDLDRVLSGALRELNRHLPLHLCAVWLVDDSPAGGVTLAEVGSVLAGQAQDFGLLPGMRLALSEVPFASCLQDGKAVYLDLEWPEARATSLGRRLAESGATCCFAVPLGLPAGLTTSLRPSATPATSPVGVLQSICTRPSGFTNEHVQLLYLVADLLGPAISSCRLYGQLRKAYEQLQLTQHQLAQSEKMRALGELAGGMAHDFNNALCGVLGFLELVLLA